jgi:predicted CoA-substrate-specific enzyme activase
MTSSEIERSIGICCGATTVSLVDLRRNGHGPVVTAARAIRHEGSPREAIESLMAEAEVTGQDLIAVTGRRFRNLLDLPTIPEPEAFEEALRFLGRDVPRAGAGGGNGHGEVVAPSDGAGPFTAAISAGGETLIVYGLDATGRIVSVQTGNKCASGTGEFFLQQIRRMDMDLEEAVRVAQVERPYQVSGRCSVFCKSDCTHATNQGVPRGSVVAGLCRMMAGKIAELLRRVDRNRVVLVGGLAANPVLVNYLRAEVGELVVPVEHPYFEALGAALWAISNRASSPGHNGNGKVRQPSFRMHRPLDEMTGRVRFADQQRGSAGPGDVCILGIDVGSTTTKAVLLRESDSQILASEYLRTAGDPLSAARKCYRSLAKQLGDTPVTIRGLGVTGSGRKIVGLHALTPDVINEIIAHATGATHFDPDVETIFEIGGQDAKYTHLTSGVPSDYAMNEACSAGTGSFLEEAAWETLGIATEDLAGHALKARHPPDFNDQCSAFIASDIKNALQEGLSRDDVAAGIVYSVCVNYANRVKGSRPVGRRVFMQGGVCYNRAVPLAMAAVSGADITVPPEPGLMGAYGVALEVAGRLKRGEAQPADYDLHALTNREVSHKDPFRCAGGPERCDLGCSISRVVVEGKTYPFGGMCSRYERIRVGTSAIDGSEHDFVALRRRMVFGDFAPDLRALPGNAPSVGINRSLLTHTYWPLFAWFFFKLGFRPVLSEGIDNQGIEMAAAPFCYPCEIAHGTFHSLLRSRPDFLFLPHVSGVRVPGQSEPSSLCPLVQGEPFYLTRTFEREIPDETGVLTPLLDLSRSVDHQQQAFLSLADALGRSEEEVRRAFAVAAERQSALQEAFLETGREVIAAIEANPARILVVVLGRPYNAYASEANKGIPHKFASRNVTVLPQDFLELGRGNPTEHMYWSMGQQITRAAGIVAAHPQMFATYVSCFSCGPDSLLIGYVRNRMGPKPSLTLEIDSHTADAGIETRIEAFLDIVRRYQTVAGRDEDSGRGRPFRQATTRLTRDGLRIVTSEGETVSLRDPRVRVVFPSMSRYGADALAAVCRAQGVEALSLPHMTEDDLSVGKANSLCKECLPLHLTTGALLRHVETRPDREVTVYFMPTAAGPCRFGQYQVFLRNLLQRRKMPNVALLSLSTVDNYAGMGARFATLAWCATILSDLFEDIHNAILAAAEDPVVAIESLQWSWRQVLRGLRRGLIGLRGALIRVSRVLARIPGSPNLDQLPRLLLVGEIYVRKEGIARRWLPERLAHQGFVVQTAPVHQWLHYVDWLVAHSQTHRKSTARDRVASWVRRGVTRLIEKTIKALLARSGWCSAPRVDMARLMRIGATAVSPELNGEAILTIADALSEIGHSVCGVLSVGPFGCMPNRLSESLLSQSMDREHLLRVRPEPSLETLARRFSEMPFLSIESDGGPFPQTVEARLEAFVVQARRVHEAMREMRNR